MGSTGGTGLCDGEKDVSAKPLQKMPNLAIGSQQIECDGQITLLLDQVSREVWWFFVVFFFLSPKPFDSC